MKHWLTVLFLLPALALAGAPDMRDVELHKAYGITQRWDNVEQAAAWVAGVQAQKRPGEKTHRIHLTPGQWVEVQLPANTRLRLHPHHPLDANTAPPPLKFEVSSGSGLYIQQQPTSLPDGDQILDADSAAPWLARVQLDANAEQDFIFSLFISRLIKLPEIEPYRYREDIKITNEPVRYAGDIGAQLFSRIAGGESVELTIEGPARYQLQQRILLSNYNQGSHNYQLHYQLGDAAIQVVDASVSTSRHRQLLINGDPVSASNLRTDYIDVAEGKHQLRLWFSEDIILRMLKSVPDDYLFPDLNAPTHHYQAAPIPDPWLLTDQQLQDVLQPGTPLQTIQQSIMRIMVDNRRRGGGLIGPMTLMNIAHSQPDEPALLTEAQILLKRHSYYDDLPTTTTQAESRASRFAVARLRERQDRADHYLLSTTEPGALADTIESAWFTTMHNADELNFTLPKRPADSMLRIIILDHKSPAEFQLFMDNRPPLQFRIDNTSALDPARFTVNATAALAAQAVHSNRNRAWQLPIQQTQPASSLELQLPHGVKNIRVQRIDSQQQPLSLALQYRVARPYRLSDSSYLHLLEVLRKESALQPLLRACLMNIDTALDPNAQLPDQLLAELSLSQDARSAARAVVNHWVPLLRWLRTRQERYRTGIDITRETTQRTIPTNELNDILAAAKRAERNGHWLPALEYWRQLSDSKQPQHRQAALSGMLRTLLQLGEYPLAERLLRGSYLSATTTTMQQLRFKQARTLYRQQNNNIALEGLLATALSRSANLQQLPELITQLITSGRLEDALSVGLLIPGKHRPYNKLLAITVQQRAWSIFQTLLADVNDKQERALWLGYRAQALDEPEKADQYWLAAGREGEILRQKSREAQAIVTTLLQGGEPQRTLATQRLAEWQMPLPGPRIWQAATGLARSQAGMAWLYSSGINLGINTLRAQPGKPVQLRIAGPVRLRFDIQPLHESNQDLPLDGWLQVKNDTQNWISPFTGNRASTTLSWPGNQQRPGRIERRELQLPAGMHQLEISGIEQALLVRVYVEAPLLDLGLSQAAAIAPAPDWQQLAQGIRCSHVDQNNFVDCQTGKVSTPITSTPESHHLNIENLTIASSSSDGNLWQYSQPAPLKSLARLPTEHDDVSNPSTPYQNMVAMLWRLEKYGADENSTIANMEAQARSIQEQPQASFIRPLLKRATRGAEWQIIDYIPESAGIRYVEQPSNAPESPALRARAALLGSTCNNSRLLSGHDELVYSLFNLNPATLQLELIPCNLPYETSTPVQVQVSNQGKAETHVLASNTSTPHVLKIRTGRGEQVLRLRMLDPTINQFTAVRIQDPSVPRQAHTERVYLLATHNEPVRFDIEGPAWLRIDELRNNVSFSRYLAVESGWQSLQLKPDNGHSEALYRLYRRNAGVPPPASALHQASADSTPVPTPFDIPLLNIAPLAIKDDYPLHGQEDGTPSIGLRLVSRTRVDDEEESQGKRFRENFAELRGEYRYFDADSNRYWRSEILGRQREDGNPVLGFGQHLYNWPMQRWPGVQTSAHLTGFAQNPGDELPGQNSATEWAVNANARALLHVPITARTYHEPSLTLFGRAMSMSRNDRYEGSSLDRDVFSRYKAQHKRGVRVSEYLLHKPWIDTEWYSQLSVTSNDDFNLASPDNLETRFGWRQLLTSAVDVDAGFRMRHYLSDDDRTSTSTRNDLRLKLSWMRWDILQRRSEVRLFLNYDIDNSESSAFLGLFLHGGNGRGLRDFRNSEVRFSDIRKRTAPHSANRVSP